MLVPTCVGFLKRVPLWGINAVRRSHVLRPPNAISSSNAIDFDDIDNERNKLIVFDLYRNPETDKVSVSGFLKALSDCGLREDDPRLSTIIANLRQEGEKMSIERGDIELCRERFISTLDDKTSIIKKALKNQMIIPNWTSFVEEIGTLFEEARVYEDGQLATYIPQLARADPSSWAVSVCTVDGQQASFGDHARPFCLQSVSKPFTYSMVINDVGEAAVHKYVGQEPSGRLFNDICLDSENKPHNPMVNAGAILVTSLLRREESLSDRFDFCLKTLRRFAGDSFVSFKNAVFLSERETADRNYALSYYMREHKCFPEKTNIVDTLDLYFQLCSVSVTTDSLAVMAATLANGGICPLTHERIVSNRAVRDTLSLMLSCGMYDFSGKFAFKIGLPAKSGVSGDMIIVVPNCCAIALYSPRLDHYGNSVRGVKFAEKLVHKFNFHHYDSMLYSECDKIDPRKNQKALNQHNLSTLLFAVKANNVAAIKSFILNGGDLEEPDYDKRTALHIACSEGNDETLQFLLYRWGNQLEPKDRFGNTPLDNAKQYQHKECQKLMEEAMEQRKLNTNM